MKVYGLLELITIFYREKFWTKIANKNFLEWAVWFWFESDVFLKILGAGNWKEFIVIFHFK
jgi:hypothetical protein